MLRIYKVSFEENLKSDNTYVLAVSPSEAEWVVEHWLKNNNKKGNISEIKVFSYVPAVKKIETKTKGVLETLTAWNNLPGK